MLGPQQRRANLVNIGTLILSYAGEPQTWTETNRFLSSKVGLAVVVLGGVHVPRIGLTQRSRKRKGRPGSPGPPSM